MLLFVFFWLYPIVTVYVAINQVSFALAFDNRTNPLQFELESLRLDVQLLSTKIDRLQSSLRKSKMDFAQAQSTGIAIEPKVEPNSRILVTGGAGFVGSHLVERLLRSGAHVIVLDNFQTGQAKNLLHLNNHDHLEVIRRDVEKPFYYQVDQIYHLASPASPPQYMRDPVKTLRTNTLGTLNVLELAERVGARVLLASTSEVYGDPLEHPQTESYWGNVNPFGPRSCYDEGKRAAEAFAYAFSTSRGIQVRIARIFNTYGPRMHINDGRVVSNFVIQALRNESLTVHGDGQQTRSFQYISDLIDGLVLLMNSDVATPVNLGNPSEMSMKTLADHVKRETNSMSTLTYLPAVQDDPQRRCPDITLAKRTLRWSPKIELAQGLVSTVQYFRRELNLSQLNN